MRLVAGADMFKTLGRLFDVGYTSMSRNWTHTGIDSVVLRTRFSGPLDRNRYSANSVTFFQVILLVSLVVLSHEEQLRTTSRFQSHIT